MSSTDTGNRAEAMAEDHLSSRGLRTLEHNYRCKGGEIDLIMRDGEQLVFVEVRYRRRNDFGSALETVGFTKQRRLIHAAQVYLQRTGGDQPCRFDVIAIDGGNTIDWIKDAFQA